MRNTMLVLTGLFVVLVVLSAPPAEAALCFSYNASGAVHSLAVDIVGFSQVSPSGLFFASINGSWTTTGTGGGGGIVGTGYFRGGEVGGPAPDVVLVLTLLSPWQVWAVEVVLDPPGYSTGTALVNSPSVLYWTGNQFPPALLNITVVGC